MSSIQAFIGRTGGRVNLTSRNIPRNVNALNALQFLSDGTLSITQPGTSGVTDRLVGEWWTQAPATSPSPGADWEVRLTVLSGNPQDPALSTFSPDPDVWYRMGVQCDFARYDWVGSVVRMEIRPFGGSTIVASADYTMT